MYLYVSQCLGIVEHISVRLQAQTLQNCCQLFISKTPSKKPVPGPQFSTLRLEDLSHVKNSGQCIVSLQNRPFRYSEKVPGTLPQALHAQAPAWKPQALSKAVTWLWKEGNPFSFSRGFGRRPLKWQQSTRFHDHDFIPFRYTNMRLPYAKAT